MATDGRAGAVMLTVRWFSLPLICGFRMLLGTVVFAVPAVGVGVGDELAGPPPYPWLD
jgi:hypothetical protein